MIFSLRSKRSCAFLERKTQDRRPNEFWPRENWGDRKKGFLFAKNAQERLLRRLMILAEGISLRTLDVLKRF